MAYRRRQGISRATTFKEEIYHRHKKNSDDDDDDKRFRSFSSSNMSLAAQAIRASEAHHDQPHQSRDFNAYAYGDAQKEESRGFWGILAQKARAILDDDDVVSQGFVARTSIEGSTADQLYLPNEGLRKTENQTFRKSIDKLTSSLNQIGDSFEKAFEEGRTIVENKTADIIQETRKLQIMRKGTEVETQAYAGDNGTSMQQNLMEPSQKNQTTHQTQLKASRDVAMATAAKAKLLLRELKTVKSDLAFSKERCGQLEEENRVLRENREKGSNAADDDMIRLQLETLLGEKARLAHENSVYARENRFLREIVEYHQLTMQDVVYIDEGIEEVAEVYPSFTRMLSVTPSPSPPSPLSPSSPSTKEIYPEAENPPQETREFSATLTSQSPETPLPEKDFEKGGPSEAST